jgi:toxin-antitoxin system PIN domain toxin
MSFGIDVNVLLYASDSGCAEHERAKSFLQQCVDGGELFCLAWLTLMGYLRMATHPSIFARPLTAPQAMSNVGALLALPHCRVIGELDGFWDVYRQVSADRPPRGNLVPDAHLAAILRQHGVRTLYTRDRDFLRFGFLEVRDPLG